MTEFSPKLIELAEKLYSERKIANATTWKQLSHNDRSPWIVAAQKEMGVTSANNIAN